MCLEFLPLRCLGENGGNKEGVTLDLGLPGEQAGAGRWWRGKVGLSEERDRVPVGRGWDIQGAESECLSTGGAMSGDC